MIEELLSVPVPAMLVWLLYKVTALDKKVCRIEGYLNGKNSK